MHISTFQIQPRVKCELHVSNNVPTVYHPLDIRCFIDGIDGRPYPWKMDRRYKSPAPNAYDASKVSLPKF